MPVKILNMSNKSSSREKGNLKKHSTVQLSILTALTQINVKQNRVKCCPLHVHFLVHELLNQIHTCMFLDVINLKHHC